MVEKTITIEYDDNYSLAEVGLEVATRLLKEFGVDYEITVDDDTMVIEYSINHEK